MQQFKISQSVTARTKTVDNYLKDISAIPLIDAAEETELAEKIRSGDDIAFQRLVEANLRFVVSVAKQYQGSGMELSDLINEGNLGLMKAASRFDPTRGFKFISYAVWWIRQQIMMAISEQGRMVRLPLNQVAVLNRINKARNKFIMENEREPSDKELSEFLDLTPDKIDEALSHSAKHVSFDVPFTDEDDGNLLDIVPDKDAAPADATLQMESLQTDVQVVLNLLSSREREIVSMAFGIGCQEMSLDEIGEKMHLTRERVRQIKEKAVRKLSKPEFRKVLVQYV